MPRRIPEYTAEHRAEMVMTIFSLYPYKPLSPIHLAELIAAPWCCVDGTRYPDGAPVARVLQRIGAVRVARGLYTAPKVEG